MKYLRIIRFCWGLIKRAIVETIYLSTKYKGENDLTLKLADETTPNIKRESTFFYNSFLLVKLCVFLL